MTAPLSSGWAALPAPALHVILSEHGVKKKLQRDFDPGEAERLLDGLVPGVRTLTGALA